MSAHHDDRRPGSAESELAKERTFGGRGKEASREIRRIDLHDFDRRFDEIADEVWSASIDIGFFQVINHGIDQQTIDRAFELTESFFAQPAERKAQWPLLSGTNSGWEDRTQVRPSTGTQDQKESYQITVPRMETLDLWPSEDELADFKRFMIDFERQNHLLGMAILRCFADRLGFEREFFTARHDPLSPQYQCTLRLLHYLAMDEAETDQDHWRAGAHTDYDCLTLLHQVPGQGGLQVCPGKEADELAWTNVEPADGVVTCNIGDMLMRWSDDLLPSTLHRVRMPESVEGDGPRYSIGYFCQADGDAIIQGPAKRYEPITAADYLQQRIAANFAA